MNVRVIQVTNERAVKFKVQFRAFWLIWYDYTEDDVAIDGWGSAQYIRYWNSVHEAQEWIYEHWGHPTERIVKQLIV